MIKVKEESEKAGLKFSIQKFKTMASALITSWQIEAEKVEAVTDFIFLGSKIYCSHEIKRCLLLGRNSMLNIVQFSSVQFSRSVMSDSLRPHE